MQDGIRQRESQDTNTHCARTGILRMESEIGKPPIQNGPEAFARRILEGTRRHYHDA